MRNNIANLNKNARTTVGAGLDSARDHRGITLIALILTIIVLLILAGVALNFIVGQNGILTHSETSKQKYELASAREELEMVIADIQTEIIKTEGRKATLVDLENRIDKNKYSIILSTDPIATTTAVSANYTYATVVELEKEIEFTVDAKLIIKEVELVSVKQGTAEVEISTAIKSYVGKDENNKYRVKYEITLSTMQGVKSIKVESGEEKQELTIDENLTKEVRVEIGKVYTITVTMEDGKYKRKTIYDRATETIKTAEELAQFRDKVNSGLSYEGKTVELANDINLQGSETNQWTPIGTLAVAFAGTFDGKNHAINNLYINSNKSNQALFSYNSGILKQIKLKDGSISGGDYTAGILSINNGTVEKCANISTDITGTKNTGGVVCINNKKVSNSYNSANITGNGSGIEISVGGTVGYNTREMYGCYNTGNVTGNMNGNYNINVGGVTGYVAGSNAIAYGCYNLGKIYSKRINCNSNTATIRIGGISGTVYPSGATLRYAYSIGEISASDSANKILIGKGVGYNCKGTVWNIFSNGGNIIGNNSGSTSGNNNSIPIAEQISTEYFTNDIKIKVKDETTGEEKEVWKYNDGYPILKWQLENN